jgi:ATP-dependent Clp protease adaptor protein ClpS
MPKIKEEVDYELMLDEPSMYRVLLHNDDYTTMDFVVMVLKKVFHKTQEQSEQIMLDVHKKGKGVCGVYTFEIAQTKVEQVKLLAKQNEFPLLATYEEDH